MSRQHPRGAALLSAMLLVALVATLSVAATWQQWRSTEVERAERLRIQSRWLLQGATDWARLILREDARSDASDHLAEPWSVPLEEAKISTFLGTSSDADTAMDALGSASLSGDITDLQSRFNLRNLLQDGRPHAPSVRTLARLFDALRLPPQELEMLLTQLTLALEVPTPGQTAGAHPLLPSEATQLPWLGLSAATALALQPYVVLLPERTPINLNTAPVPMLQACLDGLDTAGAQQLARARTQNHFRSLADVQRATALTDMPLNDAQHSVSTRYFSIRARLRLGDLVTEERTVVRRDGLQVKSLAQAHGAPQTRSLQ
ncbi:MAG: type II secretion system minor pseudopilin GspK [Rhodoferax sp.]|nr:type II secretion system minor pseudopilin GspK [Rhodoferax sp.]